MNAIHVNLQLGIFIYCTAEWHTAGIKSFVCRVTIYRSCTYAEIFIAQKVIYNGLYILDLVYIMVYCAIKHSTSEMPREGIASV